MVGRCLFVIVLNSESFGNQTLLVLEPKVHSFQEVTDALW